MATMMRSAVILALLCAGAARAELTGNVQPAEFPPESYAGTQYVDSRGCVFVRAGFDGAVNWVPRVDRERRHLCGFKPSRVSASPAAQAPQSPPVEVIAVEPGSAPRPVPPAPETAPAAAMPGPAEAPRAPQATLVAARVAAPAPAQATAPRLRPAADPAPRAAAPAVLAGGAPAETRVEYRVREVPAGAKVTMPSGRSYTTRVPTRVRQQVAVAPPPDIKAARAAPVVLDVQSARAYRLGLDLKPPRGYKRVFEDRYNPARGVQTLQGKQAMDLIWTQTVPRRLITD